MAQVNGHCDPRFEELRTLLEENIASGAEVGASICVNIDGNNVVDIWGGFTDRESQQPWQEDTIINVWSTTKTITSLAALMAVDRGLLDVHNKVAKYWPEFGQNGKEEVEVRHLLSHSSGVPGWEQPVKLEDIYDLDHSTDKLAAQKLWFEPGTASGYQALTMGHLVGKLVCQTTGQTLKEFIAHEIANPLGADFQLGAVESDWPRISTLIPPPPLTESFPMEQEKSISYRALTGPAPDALVALSEDWRRAEIGAANGHGNARSVARILSIISLGGIVDDIRFLSPETINLIFQEQTNGPDLVLGVPVRFGIGYGLPNKHSTPFIPAGRKCFWGGWVSDPVLFVC